MGTWESERGHVSDEMADILGAAFDKIGTLPTEPRMIDLMKAIECATGGVRGDPDIVIIIGYALVKITVLSSRPSMIDVADAIEFVSRGSLLVEVIERPGDTPALTVALHPAADELGIMPVANIGNQRLFETIPNRGQIHAKEEEKAGSAV